jgi:hypothetical protein
MVDGHEQIVVVARIHPSGQGNLPKVAEARNAFSVGSASRKNGEEHRAQYGHDRHDDQKLNQRKGTATQAH